MMKTLRGFFESEIARRFPQGRILYWTVVATVMELLPTAEIKAQEEPQWKPGTQT